MSYAGLASARQSVTQLAGIVDHVVDAQWEMPSACDGWRLIDVVAHLGALAHEAVDPPAPDPTWPKNHERYHDMRVDERRGWSHPEVIDEWRTYSPLQLELLESGQPPPFGDEPIELSGLGTYDRHLLANMMAFNVLCHLRYDMLAPRGPLGVTMPELTDDLVAPAIEFMLAGLPQMQGTDLDASVGAPLVMNLTGPGATLATVHPADGSQDRLTVQPGASGSTTITSSASDFIAWATTRKPWREFCHISGDASAATPFLDRVNII